MNARVLMASLVVLAIAAPAANALTITNSDTKDITLKVLPKGGKEASLTIKAGAKADVNCKMGCKLTLGALNEQVGGKRKAIVIKDGKFVM